MNKNKKLINIILLIFILQSMMIIFLIPLQEFPDAYHHITKINNSKLTSNLYYKIQDFIIYGKINFLNNIYANSNFKFANNFSIFKYSNYTITRGILGQILNIIITIFSIYLLKRVLKKEKKMSYSEKNKFMRISLLFYIYPQINYYLTNLSSDFLVILYQPFFIYFIYTNKIKINILCMYIFLKVVDNNIFTNIVFFLVYYSISFYLKNQKKKSKLKLLIITIIGMIIIYLIMKSSLLKIYFPNIYMHQIYNYNVGSQSFIRRIAAIILSSLYLTGSMSFRLPWIIYFAYIFILLKIYMKLFMNKKITRQFILWLTSFITIGVVLLIIPTLGQLKYYTYIVFFILEGIFTIFFKNKKLLLKNIYMMMGIFTFMNTLLTLYVCFKIYNIINI